MLLEEVDAPGDPTLGGHIDGHGLGLVEADVAHHDLVAAGDDLLELHAAVDLTTEETT